MSLESFYARAKTKLEALIPHTVVHLIIASLINVLTLSLSRGGGFYLGREIANWEDRHKFTPGRFRWDDFLWPFLPWLVIEIGVKWWVLWHAIQHM